MHMWPLCRPDVFFLHSNYSVIPGNSVHINLNCIQNTHKVFLTDTIWKKRDIFSDLLYNHSAAMKCPEGSANTHCLAQETLQAVKDRECDFKRKVTAKSSSDRCKKKKKETRQKRVSNKFQVWVGQQLSRVEMLFVLEDKRVERKIFNNHVIIWTYKEYMSYNLRFLETGK